MPWLKLAAIGAGILVAFLAVGWVIGVVIHALSSLVIAAIVVGGIVVAVKVARSRKQVGGKKAEREVRDRDYERHSRPLPRADAAPMSPPPPPPARPAAKDVDDDLTRLKREMGL